MSEESSVKKPRTAASSSDSRSGISSGWDGKTHFLTRRPYSQGYLELLKTRKSLPCWEARERFLRAVVSSQVVVLEGETGSGKTTQMPQFLVEAGFAKPGRGVVVTQPRRVAAMSVALRVSQEFDVELGEEVGYTIRFEDKSSEATVLTYMTDGMLLREAMCDPSLGEYAVVVLDEAHERTVSTDVLFGLVKQALEVRRKDNPLKVVVMSATLDAEKFQVYFDKAPLLKVPGRMYPVETFFTLRPEKDYMDAAIETCVLINAHEPLGDVLLFLTGEEEIMQACQSIEAQCEKHETKVQVLPLFAALLPQEQRKIFHRTAQGMRKIVVSTNIAETSVTIDGVVYVVDPGFFKQKMYNPRTHVESLLVSPISKAAAMQRAGRAGRTQPGKCFRLYTMTAFQQELVEATHPEILRSNLASVILTMKSLGVDDIVHFDFMDPPAPEAMMRALETLLQLGAVDEECDLTKAGKDMTQFPLEPELSASVIAASELGCLEEMLGLVAMLSVPNPFARPRQSAKKADAAHREFASTVGDHMTMLNAFDAYEGCGKDAKAKQNLCWESYLSERSFKQAENIKRQLRRIAERLGLLVTPPKEKERATLVRKALLGGYSANVAHYEGKAYITCQDKQLVQVHPGSVLKHTPEWVVYKEFVLTDNCFIRTVSALQPEWLIERCPSRYHPSVKKAQSLTADALQSLQRAEKRLKM